LPADRFSNFVAKARIYEPIALAGLLGTMNDAGTQEAVAKEVSDRLAKATSELQEKYARGQGGVEESVSAPTGTAYKEQHAQQEKDKAEKRQKKAAAQKQQNQVAASEMDVGDIDEDEVEDEEDFELRRIKEARLRQIKSAHNQMLENIGKGHGQFRDIVQDEFIGQVTSSNVVICHFYHKDFQKCRVMDHHLAKLAPRHIESKFIKIDAEKAPFFVEKVSALPVSCNFRCFYPGTKTRGITLVQ
jgi:DNA polymerase III gamma/tau subunit